MGAQPDTIAFDRARGPQETAAPVETGRPVWAMALLVYSAMLPREMRLELGGLVIYPDRAVLYALIPLVIIAIARGTTKFRPIDAAALAASAWMLIAMSVVYGVDVGVERGGALAGDFLLSYLLGRICIGSIRDFQRLLVIIAPGIAVTGAIMLLESVSHQLILKPLAAQVFGPLPFYVGTDVIGNQGFERELRLGLLRASAGFQHSILAGTFLCNALALYIFSRLKRSLRFSALLGCSLGLFSLSSTAIVVWALAIGLSAYEIIQRKVREISWPLFAISLTGLIIFLQIFSKSGAISVFIRYFTLNPGTGYFRTLIWEYGSASVARHPWVGIGFGGYERPEWMITDSIDAHWLLAAVRFGLPVAIFLAIVFLGALIGIARASGRAPERDRMILRSIAFFLAGVVLAGFTVAFSGSIFAFFTAMAGIAVTLSGAYNRNSLARA